MSIKIMLDPGHGGHDPGAVANSLREKDLTLDICQRIRHILKTEYTGVEVRMTRESDTYLDLSTRARMANQWGADLFLSIHINASGSGKGTGFESFIYNGNVSSQTVALQNVLHDKILAAMRQFGNITDRGKKRANYAVLRETNMSAVLTENLFIDHVGDAAKLKSEQFLQQIAYGHVQGIVKAFGLKKKAVKDDVVGHWAEQSIRKAIKAGIIKGYSDGQFKPDEPVTRAQLAVILDRLGLVK